MKKLKKDHFDQRSLKSSDKLSEEETKILLIELVHMLSYGSQFEQGMNLRELQILLKTPIKEKGNLTPEECIRHYGRKFLNEIKIFLNENYS